MKLAPIVLFVYNRPWHTSQVLEALKNADLSEESDLFIFADGPSSNADSVTLDKITEVRKLVHSAHCCRSIEIKESQANQGLAASIISGVTQIVEKYGRAIILEDDIVVSRGFLKFMNDALETYQDNERVFHISGYMYPNNGELPETFFYNVPLCWGWATWKRAWAHFFGDAGELIRYMDQTNSWKLFNKFSGTFLEDQLRKNGSGQLNTWFIKWHGSALKNNAFTLFPGRSLVENIGFDNSGIHNSQTKAFNIGTLAQNIPVHPIELKESKVAERIIKLFYQKLSAQSIKAPISRGRIRNLFTDNSFGFLCRKLINKIIRWAFPELNVFKKTDYNPLVLESKNTNSIMGEFTRLYPHYQMEGSVLGDYTYVAPNSHISMSIIGNFCSIGPNFMCGWGIHPLDGISTSPVFYSGRREDRITFSNEDKIIERRTIVIGNDVFIGANVTILDGVEIGDGAVIGAGTVVTKNIPPYAIVAGSPMQIIRYRFDEKIIQHLLEIKWWYFPPERLRDVERQFFDINQFVCTHKLQ